MPLKKKKKSKKIVILCYLSPSQSWLHQYRSASSMVIHTWIPVPVLRLNVQEDIVWPAQERIQWVSRTIRRSCVLLWHWFKERAALNGPRGQVPWLRVSWWWAVSFNEKPSLVPTMDSAPGARYVPLPITECANNFVALSR